MSSVKNLIILVLTDPKWPPRSLEDHKKSALKHFNSNTKTEQKKIERDHDADIQFC